MLGYGGNTSCVEVRLDDGTELILDAGTGIRELALAKAPHSRCVQMLLTHLHMDHIQGLLFFPPLFDPGTDVTVYGPPAPGPGLDRRLARYLSAPLSPVDLRELPARVNFAACPYSEWRVGEARIRAAIVAHRGVTVGYRIEEGDASLCYLPDHEPALGAELTSTNQEWISGMGLATRASILIHDAQYSHEEYPAHVGWGHSSIRDSAAFAVRSEAERVVLFHHDPTHDDRAIEQLADDAKAVWEHAGRSPEELTMAKEGDVLEP
jgi:phosphoribosyl 1,2-cyclic phosphodiesterase